MGSLQEQLAKAGIVSEREVRAIEASRTMEAEAAQIKLQQMAVKKHINTLDDLRDTPNTREFRDKARKLLVERPDLIREVLKLAHNFKDQDGGKKLIWQFFQIRDSLADVAGSERERFLKRALRAHGTTFEVSSNQMTE